MNVTWSCQENLQGGSGILFGLEEWVECEHFKGGVRIQAKPDLF